MRLDILLHDNQKIEDLDKFKKKYDNCNINNYNQDETYQVGDLFYISGSNFTLEYLAKIIDIYTTETIFITEYILESIYSKLLEYLSKGKLELIGSIKNSRQYICFRMITDISDDYKMLDIKQSYCFVPDEKILQEKLKNIKYGFPILEFIPVLKADLLGLDDWRQNLINDGLLNPMVNNISADDIVEWISHRTLWTHFLTSGLNGILVLLDSHKVGDPLPERVLDKKLIAYYKDNDTLN